MVKNNATPRARPRRSIVFGWIDRALASVSPGQQPAYTELLRRSVRLGFWSIVVVLHIVAIYTVASLVGGEVAAALTGFVESMGSPAAVWLAAGLAFGGTAMLVALGASSETRTDRCLEARYRLTGKVARLDESRLAQALAKLLDLELLAGRSGKSEARLEGDVKSTGKAAQPAAIGGLVLGVSLLGAAAAVAYHTMTVAAAAPVAQTLVRFAGVALMSIAGVDAIRFGRRLASLRRYRALGVTARLVPAHPSQLLVIKNDESGLDTTRLEACRDWSLRIEIAKVTSESVHGSRKRATAFRTVDADVEAAIQAVERFAEKQLPRLMRSA